MKEDRLKIWAEYIGDKTGLEGTWLKYNRYFEAEHCLNPIGIEKVKGLKVLDYGCGVGDMGMFFARLGANVSFFDFAHILEFVKFRASREKLPVTLISVEKKYADYLIYDFAIFGEVLEHLDDPLRVVTKFVQQETKYIFTSSYPYRSDDPNDYYWKQSGHKEHIHTREMQKPIREMLEANYKYERFDGQNRIWIRK